MSHYARSWEIYKAHTESFLDDHNYYLNFCRGKKTLELFAGYGRLSNFLIKNNIDLETVELEPNFTEQINLTNEKNHVGNVLNFISLKKFERIIAGYNSFCLILKEDEVFKLFRVIDAMLVPGGQASLSYYHTNFWPKSERDSFTFKGHNVEYIPSYDLSQLDKDKAVWIDQYRLADRLEKYTYPVRVYRTREDIIKYLEGTNLQYIKTIYDYNNKNISEPGWRDFVFEKKRG